MTDERWGRVKALFQAAVERPPEEREAFLATATADEVLRREVESLLTADTSDGFLDQFAVAAVLTPGVRVGPYEIVAPIGAGAMGEVYRARDTNLHRDVALKVLPGLFAVDPDRHARFTREAQLLATLNHPNIAAIYGLEESTGGRALVLELVDGWTLADRIARGPIPLAEALPIARQIGDALEAAHEKGIIHRDLKPANIKIAANGVVKVLDFGLAKVWDGAPQSELSGSPKLTAANLGERTILGTPAYMCPEQARGQSLDKRTDIWAFGCVLYEMLTGRAPFEGETISDTIAAILEREPDWTALPATVPAAVRTLIRRCLEKDARQRIADISTVQFVFDDVTDVASFAEPGGPATTAPRPRLWRRVAIPSVAWLVGVAMAGGAVWFAMRPTAPPRLSRTHITLPSAAALSVDRPGLAVTPDGTRVVYAGVDPEGLYVRALDQLDVTTLTRLGEPYGAFVSPDGQWVGFFEGVSSLNRVAITGGPVSTIGRPGGTAMGASWGADGTIIFATNDWATGLQRIADTGGEPIVLTRPNRAGGEGDHLFPEILPGGQAVLFTITSTTPGLGQAQIAVLDLRTGAQTALIRGGSNARYVPSGHLIYAAAGKLHAVAFDLARLAVVGAPVRIQPEVLPPPTQTDTSWAVAADGTLVYALGDGPIVERSLVWVDRQGRETQIPGAPPRNYAFPRLSPDGTRLAIYIPDQEIDIWLLDLIRPTFRRATLDPTVDIFPVWRDDRQLLFSSNREGGVNLFAQAADGSGGVTRLTTSPNVQHANSVSPDGSRLVFTETAQTTAQDIMELRLDGTAAVRPLVATRHRERNAEVSPDGRWLAYEADDSGRYDIYVRPFPDVSSGHWHVSVDGNGGTRPLWARNSKELFYRSLTGDLMRVGVAPGKAWAPTAPDKVFEGRRYGATASQRGRTYDIALDGKRFLMIKPVSGADQTAGPTSLIVVQNWGEELKRLVPTH